MQVERGSATVVIPHWTSDLRRTERHLAAALDGLARQSDTNWRAVLIDDASPEPEVREHLLALERESDGQLHVILRDRNDGPGVCRNAGIRWAQGNGSPLVLFNDADDLSDPRRLESVRGVFVERPDSGVVYSTFSVIDQDGRILAPHEVTASVAEVLKEHQQGPPQGDDAWIAIGTETGYINHTSSTAVRTELAVQYPFPPERVSEDAHTWFRYSAGGGRFVYIDEPLSAYRTTADPAGSSSRAREGGKSGFYTAKARVDSAGFREAVRIATASGRIRPEDQDGLVIRFHLRLGLTLAREGLPDLARDQVRAAMAVSPGLTRQLIEQQPYAAQPWVSTNG